MLLAAELDRIRKVGVSITSVEFDQGAVGVAVSIQKKFLGIKASLSFIFAASEFGKVNDHTLTAPFNLACRFDRKLHRGSLSRHLAPGKA